MRKIGLLMIFLLASPLSKSQKIILNGNVNDTIARHGLPNALLMVLKFNDSTLVQYTRSNSLGIFKTIKIPIDTYVVIITHPSYADKTYILIPTSKDTVFNFKNVVLPQKSVILHEVEILANQERSFYRGDTLIFIADSFKTVLNATVEDLLKKLTGVQVNIDGKIMVQGQRVDKVLVDGDEFFGSDATIATRNLNASSIESIQVYDKKTVNAQEQANESLKVLNLKLKEESKKGYFGKLTGATDFKRFYHSEFLVNNFNGSRKFSAYGLIANIPPNGSSPGNNNKSGPSNDQNSANSSDLNSLSKNPNQIVGIPETIKTGFLFNDNINKYTKINCEYNFKLNEITAESETNIQFFLTDTSYNNFRIQNNYSKNQGHNINFKIVQKIDSLTELIVNPKLELNKNRTQSKQTDDFLTSQNYKTRSTEIINEGWNESTNADIFITLSRNFSKKNRNISLTYQPVYYSCLGGNNYNTNFIFYSNNLKDSSLVQKRQTDNFKLEHNASVTLLEPFNKKIKTEISLFFTFNNSNNNRQTFNNSISGYDILDSNLSNNFDDRRHIYKSSIKLIYDFKKNKVMLGMYVRRTVQRNIDLDRNKKLTQTTNNISPVASYNYIINKASSISLYYISNSQQPELQQIQPVRDNSDPNRTSLGNPSLKPSFSNNLNFNYSFYRAISNINFWSGGNYCNTINQISYATHYDSIGRAVTIPVNINGNYFSNIWLGGEFPIFQKFMTTSYSINGGFSNFVSIVNSVKNISQNSSIGAGLTLSKYMDKCNLSIGGNYKYIVPKTNISEHSNQPYYTYGVVGNITITFPRIFKISIDGQYINNGNRTEGFNFNYFILNTSLSKTFLKLENLVFSLNANDILNQNINNERFINSNQIVDTKTQIIRRYVLLKILYKFNKQRPNKKEEDNY